MLCSHRCHFSTWIRDTVVRDGDRDKTETSKKVSRNIHLGLFAMPKNIKIDFQKKTLRSVCVCPGVSKDARKKLELVWQIVSENLEWKGVRLVKAVFPNSWSVIGYRKISEESENFVSNKETPSA